MFRSQRCDDLEKAENDRKTLAVLEGNNKWAYFQVYIFGELSMGNVLALDLTDKWAKTN